MLKRKTIITLVLALTLATAAPVSSITVLAAPLEDCDMDGFDDATGVPVPWPGFDETKGDQIPDGWSPYGDQSGSSGGGNTSSGGSGTGGSASGSQSQSSGSSNTGSSASGSQSQPAGSQSQPSAAPGQSAAPAGGTASQSSGQSQSPADTVDLEEETEELEEEEQEEEEEEESEEEKEEEDEKKKAEKEKEAIIKKKGTLEITESEGGIIHAGGSITIKGSGFAGKAEDLEIEIHSTPQLLDQVTSSAKGAFEVQVTIPEDLEAGIHNIVVSYQGTEIVRQEIEVGPKVADGFFEALFVGFTQDNKGLLPGIAILAGLIVAGAAAVVLNSFTGKKRIFWARKEVKV